MTCFYFFFPLKNFFIISKTREVICRCFACLPVYFYRHSRFPFGRHTKVTRTASSLPWANDINTRLPVDTKVVDSPVGMVDGLDGSTPHR